MRSVHYTISFMGTVYQSYDDSRITHHWTACNLPAGALPSASALFH